MSGARHRLDALGVRRMVADGRRRLLDLAQRVDGLEERLRAGGAAGVARPRSELARLQDALANRSPRVRWALLRGRLGHARVRLVAAAAGPLRARRERVLRAAGTLEALSPLGVLARGYGICRRWPGLEIVKDAATVAAGSEVQVVLHRGEIRCRVEGRR